jgi:drug/metabolite transporter (DMT)-like permease
LKIEAARGSAPSGGVIAASIAILVIVWAVNFVVGKIGLRSLPPLTLASFRVVLAGFVMIPTYYLCSFHPTFRETAEIRRRGFTLRDFWTFLYLGFFGVSINQICFTTGLRYTSVSHSAVIVGLGPIYTLVLAVLFKQEELSWRKAAGMTVALAGIALMAWQVGATSRGPSILGDAITMTGSVGFAIYVVLGKRVAGKYDSLTMTAFNHFAGAIIVLPLAIHGARTLTLDAAWRKVPWSGWASVAYMAIFSSALAYVFYFWLLRYLEASQLAAFTYVLPVMATVLGILLLGEKGTWSQAIGGAVALAGVYWIEAGRGR